VNLRLQPDNSGKSNSVLVAELKPGTTNAAELKPGSTSVGPGAAAPKPKMDIIWKIGDQVILSRSPATGDVRFWNSSTNPAGGFMTVVPMVFGSAFCMIIFSLLTKPPGRETIDKYFKKQ
jgi:hypothetical protein